LVEPCATGAACQGRLTPETWVRLVVSLWLRGASGRLIVTRANHQRELRLVGGWPVDFRSTVGAESIEHTLVDGDIVPADRVAWVQRHLGAGESLLDGLEMAGALTAESRAAHAAFRLHRGVVAPLQWPQAKWRFESHRRLRRAGIDPALLPTVAPLPALHLGSEAHVDIDGTLARLVAPGQGPLRRSADFDRAFRSLEVGEPLSALPDIIASAADPEAILGALSQHLAPVVRMMWLLQAAGLVTPASGGGSHPVDVALDAALAEAAPPLGQSDALAESPAPASSPAASSPAASSPAARARAPRSPTASGSSRAVPAPAPPCAAPAPSVRARRPPAGAAGNRRTRGPTRQVLERMVQSDFQHRMEVDHYAFLAIPDDADAETVTTAVGRLVRRWRLVEVRADLTPDARRMAHALIGRAGEVRATLSDAERRRTYDAQRAAAPRPSAGVDGGGPPLDPTEAAVAEAQRRMEAKDFPGALRLLTQARIDAPSHPGVLAELGWASWRCRGAKSGDDALDYVKLALTFDGRSERALEYLARIALDREDAALARTALVRLTRLQPKERWPRAALKRLEAELADSGGAASNEGGRRFWRDGASE
jgi:hypothetical protein